MKALFIFLGECFREGGPHSRRRDTTFGYDNQKEASISHIKLIKKLVDYKVDVAINTYETKYKNDLLSWYENIIFSNFTDKSYGISSCPSALDFKNVVHNSLQVILNNINIECYEFIFICRFDLLLKEELIITFNPFINTIHYPNVMCIDKEPIIFPSISDVFCIIPKKYFNTMGNWRGLINSTNYILWPGSIRDLLLNGLTMDDIDFLSDKIYVANTIQSKNPLYKLNSRPEASDLRDCDKYLRYIKERQEIIRERN